ncbi:MAG: hypothetical protein COX62_05705, partial [Deltaproteobacteria bacterium CG_4_10_14_0_2_um_filter_43_8]
MAKVSQEKNEKKIKELIEAGKKKGFLTFEELNKSLPNEMVATDQLDSVLALFEDMGVEIVTTEEEGVKAAAKTKEKDDADDMKAAVEEEQVAMRTTDPVRMYLRKMGQVPLLTREGEVEIAKRIERGQNEMLSHLLCSISGMNLINDLADRLSKGELKVADIIVKDSDDVSDELAEQFEGNSEEVNEEEAAKAEELAQRTRLLKMFSKLRQIDKSRKLAEEKVGKKLPKAKLKAAEAKAKESHDKLLELF